MKYDLTINGYDTDKQEPQGHEITARFRNKDGDSALKLINEFMESFENKERLDLLTIYISKANF